MMRIGTEQEYRSRVSVYGFENSLLSLLLKSDPEPVDAFLNLTISCMIDPVAVLSALFMYAGLTAHCE